MTVERLVCRAVTLIYIRQMQLEAPNHMLQPMLRTCVSGTYRRQLRSIKS